MESAEAVTVEEMCIYISCFCEATATSFFSCLCGCLVNKASSGGMCGGRLGVGWGGGQDDGMKTERNQEATKEIRQGEV